MLDRWYFLHCREQIIPCVRSGNSSSMGGHRATPDTSAVRTNWNDGHQWFNLIGLQWCLRSISGVLLKWHNKWSKRHCKHGWRFLNNKTEVVPYPLICAFDFTQPCYRNTFTPGNIFQGIFHKSQVASFEFLNNHGKKTSTCSHHTLSLFSLSEIVLLTDNAKVQPGFLKYTEIKLLI